MVGRDVPQCNVVNVMVDIILLSVQNISKNNSKLIPKVNVQILNKNVRSISGTEKGCKSWPYVSNNNKNNTYHTN